MNVLNNVKYCYGCGVCAASCPKKIINIQLNKDGFYEPNIYKLTDCVSCGICIDVCAFEHKEISSPNFPIKSWAAWSKDSNIRSKCSSGGVSFEIGKYLIDNGYFAVGCRYNIENHRAEHFISSTVEDFEQSIGSKYIQSYTEEVFKKIIKNNKSYVIIGTPCQIDSIRRMIRRFHCESNFVLIDFFCHSVPSMLAWKSYLNMLKQEVGCIKNVSWRNKSLGWHESYCMKVWGEKKIKQSWYSKGDVFYKLFLGDLCIAPQCQYDCKYKYKNSSADLRIGDFWGDTYKNDRKGVSALVAFTEKGLSIVESMDSLFLNELPFDVVAQGQMRNNAKANPLRNYILNHLREHGIIDCKSLLIINMAIKLKRLLSYINDPQKTINSFIKKIKK